MWAQDGGQEPLLSRPYVGVAHLEMCAPPHNFLSADRVGRLADALEYLDQDNACRAVLLSAQGRSFCAGANLGSGHAEETNMRDVGDSLEALYRHAVRIFRCRKPLVAAIQGPAVGGGLGLALAADFRIAGPAARFSANFAKLGTHPGFGLTATLPALVGHQFAQQMFFTGRRVPAWDAHHVGLVDLVTPEDSLLDSAAALAVEIAEGAPLSLLSIRATLRRGLPERVEAAMSRELEAQRRLRVTRDYAEGVRAVADRRPGNFHCR